MNREQMNKNFTAVNKRLGPTTGASKGKKPLPKVETKITPRGNLKSGLTGGKITMTKKF